jgi:hypothetical protein
VIGKVAVPPEVRAKLVHYPEPGRAAAKAIPHATLVEFTGHGHAAQMQDPDGFHKALLEGLAGADESLSVRTFFCPVTVFLRRPPLGRTGGRRPVAVIGARTLLNIQPSASLSQAAVERAGHRRVAAHGLRKARRTVFDFKKPSNDTRLS